MKRLLALALTLLLTPGLVEAQYTVGFRGGLANTNIVLEDAEDSFDSKTGLVVGGFVQFPMGETLGLQTGLNYTQKGAESADDEGTLEIAYLEVPVLGVLDFATSGPVGVRIMAGPVVGFNMSCEISFDGGSVDCDDTETDLKSFDLGLLFGGGLLYQLDGAASLFLEAGYNLGVMDVNDDEDPEANFAKNRALMVTAGVSFPMGG